MCMSLTTQCVAFSWCYSECVFWTFVFFFFKQKTAYEMRISDWSSDVCSSDLKRKDDGWDGVLVLTDDTLESGKAAYYGGNVGSIESMNKLQRGVSTALEIGRASCRERVCQYV